MNEKQKNVFDSDRSCALQCEPKKKRIKKQQTRHSFYSNELSVATWEATCGNGKTRTSHILYSYVWCAAVCSRPSLVHPTTQQTGLRHLVCIQLRQIFAPAKISLFNSFGLAAHPTTPSVIRCNCRDFLAFISFSVGCPMAAGQVTSHQYSNWMDQHSTQQEKKEN